MRIVRVGCWAAWLALAASAFAISEPPVPIWPSDGKIPDSLKNQYVFLTPDLGSVVVVFPPEEEGSKRKILRLTIHNRIYPTISVDISRRSGSFAYEYSLFSRNTSKDSITTFSIVVSHDPDIQTSTGRWKGGVMTNTEAKRIGLSAASDGWWVTWFCPSSEPLAPGSSARFVLESAHRPGFTNASVAHFPAFNISEYWPEEVIHQADLLQDPYWVDKHVITLGPRYAPEYPAGKIAADYLSGMADLLRDGRLSPDSPFVQETTDYLKGIVAGQAPAHRSHSRPASRLEREIEQGLNLCVSPE
jgi:hypothetical protein